MRTRRDPWRSRRGRRKEPPRRFYFILPWLPGGRAGGSGCPSKTKTPLDAKNKRTTRCNRTSVRSLLILLLNLVREIHLKGRAELQGGRRRRPSRPSSIPVRFIPPCHLCIVIWAALLAWWQSRVQRMAASGLCGVRGGGEAMLMWPRAARRRGAARDISGGQADALGPRLGPVRLPDFGRGRGRGWKEDDEHQRQASLDHNFR